MFEHTLESGRKKLSVTLLALNHPLSRTADNLEFIQKVHVPYCVQEQTFSEEMFLHVNDSFAFSNQLHMSTGITASVRFSCLTLMQHHASYFQMQQSVSP